MSNLVALPNGTELAGDFRIRKVLGAGGFGITYLADELALHRQVTIKEYFPTDYAARKDEMQAAPRSKDLAADYKWGLDRFIEEAQTLARFDHPNIVRVYRYFRANNTGYMVLKFEEGGSFKAWLKGLGRAPRQTELDALLGPLLDALEIIHKGDFLHRDIAPDNIMVRKDRSPVLIDFGSARGEIGPASRTVSALVKPGYSPYEQYASTSRQQGPWTDIYALAATIYQAVTGKRPPDAPSRMVKDDYVPAREAAVGSYRAGFLAALDKALRLEVSERPQSIAEWRGPLLAPDAKPVAPAARGRIGDVLGLRREPEQALPAATKVAPTKALHPPPPDAHAALGQHLDFVDDLRKAEGQPAPKPNTATLKPQPPVIAAAAEMAGVAEPRYGLGYGAAPEAHMSAALAAPKPAPSVPLAIAPKLREATPQLPVPLPQPIERRKPRKAKRAWFFLRAPWRGLIFKFATGVAVASLFTVYQDQVLRGAGVARPAALAPSAPRADAAPLQPSPRQLAQPTGSVSALNFAGEGRALVTASADGTLKIWDVANGALARSIALGAGPASALAVLDKRALTGHGDGAVQLWDLDTGERLAAFKRGSDPVIAVAFAPETDNYLSAGRDGSLAVWNRRSPQAPIQTSPQSGATGSNLLRVTARDAVAYALPDKTLRLANSESLATIRTYRGHTAPVTGIATSDDGKTLVSASTDGQVRVWSTASTRLIKSFQAHAGPVSALSLAPSGETVASIGADGVLKLWDTRRGRLIAAAEQRVAGVHVLAFAADGRRLATVAQGGSVQLWETSTLRAARD